MVKKFTITQVENLLKRFDIDIKNVLPSDAFKNQGSLEYLSNRCVQNLKVNLSSPQGGLSALEVEITGIYINKTLLKYGIKERFEYSQVVSFPV